MSDKKFPVHYANFICHFGAAELLDYLEEIVIPAFLGGGIRTFKEGKYFFHSVQLLDLGSAERPELAICGRFVKDMIVRSEQRYDPATDALLPDNQRMETAPSAIFMLLLAPHKLIYLLETAAAPGMESFRSTVQSFLSKARLKYIDDLQKRSASGDLTEDENARFPAASDAPPDIIGTDEVSDSYEGAPRKLTKKRLHELLPPADLEVVALSSNESLRKFVARFKTLQSATVRLVKPNAELDNDDFLAAVRAKADAVRAETSSLVYKNPEGLNKAQVVDQLEAAASQGNTEIRLDGKDQGGQTLRGSNDEFKVVSHLTTKPEGILATARAMLTLFKAQRNSGLISAPDHQLSDRDRARLNALAQRANGVRDHGS